MARKWVYLFSEGNASMRELLGGKGANLAEMTSLGLPVPQGFTITTEACTQYYEDGREINEEIQGQINEYITKMEEITGKKFGDHENPLLVSVRSGARASMPGMMDTILNLGLNETVVNVIAEKSGNPRWAWDCYRRFIQMYSDVVMEVGKKYFEQLIDEMKEKKGVMKYTVMTGIFAGTILACVYLSLAYMGMSSSGVFPIQENGAWTLRCIVHQLFGDTGAVLLAAIFTLACLTTCVGLITSISQYFSTLTTKLSYRQWVLLIAGFSFIICNQGLNMILSISVPVLDAIYPVSITLILLGLCHRWIKNITYIYPCTIGAVSILSVAYALENLGVSFGFAGKLLHALPLYSLGLGWVLVALVVTGLCALFYQLKTARLSRCNMETSAEPFNYTE